jgi:hypothetical protein
MIPEHQQEIPHILSYLLARYDAAPLGEAGADQEPTLLDELYASFGTQEEKNAAKTAIEHFLAASKEMLQENPPMQQIMLSEGFGVLLAGGDQVAITMPMYGEETMPGQLEAAGDVAVTMGRSLRGQRGIETTPSQPITGAGPDYTVRHPGK